MFWKVVAILSFVVGVLVGAFFLQSDNTVPVPPAARQSPPTTCAPAGGPVDTSVI